MTIIRFNVSRGIEPRLKFWMYWLQQTKRYADFHFLSKTSHHNLIRTNMIDCIRVFQEKRLIFFVLIHSVK